MRGKKLEIKTVIRGKLPQIPFQRIANEILPGRYELSLVICGDVLARRINRQHRKRSYAANVLSFPLEKNEGEIFLNMEAARREAKQYGVSLRARLMLLFVHACLHLKGMQHGTKMERAEKKVLMRFS
ncbi:rRNA maturation RNase YbeY [Candidatus Kaiserbacteria bacterium]|nr:rRNA maturation RNase YbeY [Candidatus Kaiserbacteria bacterium]